MKFIIKLIFVLFFIVCLSYSQWFVVPSGTTNLLLEMMFSDANTGNIVGSSGTIIRTTNSGANWFSQPNSTGVNLWGVFLANSQTGFVIGDGSVAHRTINSGTNWTAMSLPIFELLHGVYFNDATTGYIGASNGKIIKTTNGGNNWSELTTGTSQFINKIYFVNNSTGFAACSNGIILKTTDAGASWLLLTTVVTEHVYGIHACSLDTIYACCNGGKIIKSINGGTNWVLQISGMGERLNDIYFPNSLTGTSVGLGNVIIRTTNGGAEWLTQQSGVNEDFYAVWFTNITTGFVCGSNGKILKTTTGGFPFPSQPVLNSPPNGAAGISLTPMLDWDTVTTSKTYSLQLATDSSFINLIIDTNLLNNTQMPVQAGRLLNNTLYYWHVRGENIVGYGSYSATFRFRTIVAFPNPPNLLQPPNGANNVSLTPTFDWDSNSVATYYTLQASLDTSFTNFAIFADGITQSYYTVTNTPLNNNLRYYWRVRTTNDAGTSAWSQVFNFITVFGFPAPPSLLSPPNNTVGVSLTPTLRWVKDISATTYQAQIASDSLFNTINVDTTGFDSSQVTIRPGLLVNIHNYYWRVRTTNNFGTSGWSDTWHFFTLLSPPVAPILVSPPNNATNVDLTPTLDWDSVQYAQTYRVQVATDAGFNNLVVNVGSLPVSQYTVSGGALSNNTVYYWRVNATNGAGTGPYSAVWNFRTVISPPVVAPTLLSPPNSSTNISVTPTLDWNDVFNSQGYRLLVSSDSLFNSLNVDTTIVPSQFSIPGGILSPTTTYYWKVRGFNIGGFGPYSVTWHFTTGVVGITQISNQIPDKFELRNNFPNPFNPVTKIRFSLPLSPTGVFKVSLKIYDILGREITKLVNDNLSPGYYESSWDASNYPSGLYIYRIQANDFTSVRKMILLK